MIYSTKHAPICGSKPHLYQRPCHVLEALSMSQQYFPIHTFDAFSTCCAFPTFLATPPSIAPSTLSRTAEASRGGVWSCTAMVHVVSVVVVGRARRRGRWQTGDAALAELREDAELRQFDQMYWPTPATQQRSMTFLEAMPTTTSTASTATRRCSSPHLGGDAGHNFQGTNRQPHIPTCKEHDVLDLSTVLRPSTRTSVVPHMVMAEEHLQ